MLADLEAFRSHLEPSSAESRIPSASNDVAFRETVEHASQQMWPPPTSRAKNSFWWLGSFAAAAVLLVLLSLIPAIRDGIAGLFGRHEEHTSELQSLAYLVCRLLLEKKKKNVVLVINAYDHRLMRVAHIST